MFAQYAVDLGLVSPSIWSVCPEPCHHVGIQPQRDLLLHWPIQGTASGTGPIQNLGYVARINFLIGKGRKLLNLRLLFIVDAIEGVCHLLSRPET